MIHFGGLAGSDGAAPTSAGDGSVKAKAAARLAVKQVRSCSTY